MFVNISRRGFLAACAAVTASPLIGVPGLAADAEKRWFRGNLHMHSQWSDGKPLPEWAVDWYKTNGYDFICLSDHNIFQSDRLRFDGFGFRNPPSDAAVFKDETSLWKTISPKSGWPKLTQREVDQALQRFGADSVRTVEAGGKTYVRMTPFGELESRFAEPGKFLMIPGYEQTGSCPDGRQVHLNFINVRDVFPYTAADTPKKILAQALSKADEVYTGQDWFVTLNHPLWRYYDCSPADVAALPQLRFFELNNNEIAGGYDAHPQGYTPEKFWDVVNAHRAANKQPLLLGMGCDDRHDYGGVPKAWSVVRAASLSVKDLLQAVRAGDFYASTGLEFDDIRFDGKTLSVRAKASAEGRYRIEFIGTKKNYDTSRKIIEVAKGPRCPARRVDVFSDTIGVVLDTVEGTEGAYALKPDDLYVRAKIVRTDASSGSGVTKRPAAWTQPYAVPA